MKKHEKPAEESLENTSDEVKSVKVRKRNANSVPPKSSKKANLSEDSTEEAGDKVKAELEDETEA
jgi:hypothetical protein